MLLDFQCGPTGSYLKVKVSRSIDIMELLSDHELPEFWTYELSDWYTRIPYDGIWIDLSEPSSFCVGSCGEGLLTRNPVHPPFRLPGVSQVR